MQRDWVILDRWNLCCSGVCEAEQFVRNLIIWRVRVENEDTIAIPMAMRSFFHAKLIDQSLPASISPLFHRKQGIRLKKLQESHCDIQSPIYIYRLKYCRRIVWDSHVDELNSFDKTTESWEYLQINVNRDDLWDRKWISWNFIIENNYMEYGNFNKS